LHILGISAYYHDSAACLVTDGKIVAAAQEERFSRKRHDADFPRQAIAVCLRQGGIAVGDLTHVAFYDKPFVKFERLLDTYARLAPSGLGSFLQSMPSWLRKKLWLRDHLAEELGWDGDILFGDHHESHAASAFYPSPFDEAAILTVDGVGEWSTTSLGVGRGPSLETLLELRFPHSLGLLYSAFTAYAGFRVNSGEYKLMGLAPYGKPVFVDKIYDELIDLRDDGSFALNLDYFQFAGSERLTNRAFDRLFDGPPRAPESKIAQREMDLAASIQVVTEEVVLRLARLLHQKTSLPNLCMAGGVALNCVANGRLLREGPFEDIWIQPAAGDAGGAVGVALAIWHRYAEQPRPVPDRDAMQGALLGPAFSNDDIAAELMTKGAVLEAVAPELVAERAAELIADGKVIGWFQGRMELGPRALGARSILGDPRSPTMQSVMNLKIKFRESFRPFAPAVLRESVSDWFELDSDSPYMLIVAPVAANRRLAVDESGLAGIDLLQAVRSQIPAVTHVDGSARVQTVTADDNPRFYALLRHLDALTGCPMVINTSFNVRGEPIVCRPIEAYTCLMRTELDALVIGDFVVHKAAQPAWHEDHDWKATHVLD